MYKAKDTRLERQVAVKILGPHLAADPDRRARFEREAKTILPESSPHPCLRGARENWSRLHLRSLDTFDSTPLPGTEDASMPFFSPDGQWLGFVAGEKLKSIALSGGAALIIASAPEAVGASWGVDATILFTPTSASGLVSALRYGEKHPAPGSRPR